MDFAIGGIAIAGLIVGIVEAAKEFGVTGKGSQVLALILGVVFTGLSAAIAQELIPADVVIWVELVVTALAGGLTAMGYYNLWKRTTQDET